MGAGVLLVKSFSAGSGKTLLTVFRLHSIDLQGGFIFSATKTQNAQNTNLLSFTHVNLLCIPIIKK